MVEKSIFLAITAMILFFESIVILITIPKVWRRKEVILDKRAYLGINTDFSLIIKEQSEK